MAIQDEIQKRRTFGIISHPDAGKTTLTEKLLLYGGAIHLAGAVKAKKNQRSTTSDWMEVEKERGISISASVLNFDYAGARINLLDTPGHKDFSEDTYRTLTAVDAAVMLIDAAKGVEAQTRKLFEVCSMRGIPIFTFVNKLDRPSREPLDLIDELEKILGIRSTPLTWPIGSGDRFVGVYDLQKKEMILYDKDPEANAKRKLQTKSVQSVEAAREYIPDDELYEQLKTDLELLEVAGDPFDLEKVRSGKLSPIFFGSALTNFGVDQFLERFIELAPSPVGRKSKSAETAIAPGSPKFSSFVFKIQANMDPSHRDRVAFLRVCSGKFERNMQVEHVRLKKKLKLSRPLNFFAQERVVVEEAWPGDIVGIVDTSGDLRIGDTLSEDKSIQYEGVPRFSPEFFCSVQILDPMKRKQLKKGLDQLAEEGVVQVYYQPRLGDKDPIIGAVGGLQFEVLKHRLMAEYSVDIKMSNLPFSKARWPTSPDPSEVDTCVSSLDRREDSVHVLDRNEEPVVLFKSQWAMEWAIGHYEDIEFHSTAP